MKVVKAGCAVAGGGRALRLLAVAALSGLSLAACASVSPEMAATGARPNPAAPSAPQYSARGSARAQTHATNNTAAVAGGEGERALGGRYKLGAPYQIGGLWYVPADQPSYDEVGVASWYGDEFNGQATANGERFDMHSASAAHATLPMPSIVEVTNLENGRSIRVRLNDRGPYKAGRIIDLSRGAAEQLGYMDKGTAKVRVRYVGPARLDGSLEPLFVAQAGPAPPLKTLQLAAASSADTPPAVQAVWRSGAPAAPSSEPPAYAPQAQPLRPATAVAAATADGFAVQAGAFADRAKAQRIADQLQAAGAATVRPLDMPDRKLYRVVVGPWRDEGRAQAARTQVIALGYADARVVKAF